MAACRFSIIKALAKGLPFALILAGCSTDKDKRPDALPAISLRALSPDDQAVVNGLMNEAACTSSTRRALNIYEWIWETYPDAMEAPEALHRAAKIREHDHQYADAFRCLDTILTNYPSYSQFNDVVREEFLMATCLMEGGRPYYFGIIPGFCEYEKAIEIFEGIIKKAPFTDYAALALMNIALLQEKHGKTTEAIEALDRLINTYPKSILLPDAYLKLGDLYASLVQGAAYDQGATLDAMHYYQDFIALFPRNENIKRAETNLSRMQCILAESKLFAGNLYRNHLQDDTAALTFYNEAITVAPKSPIADCARAEIDKIQRCCPPPGTPIDFLFPKPEHAMSLKEYAEEGYVESRQNEIFNTLTDEDLLEEPFVDEYFIEAPLNQEFFSEGPLPNNDGQILEPNGVMEDILQSTETLPPTPWPCEEGPQANPVEGALEDINSPIPQSNCYQA